MALFITKTYGSKNWTESENLMKNDKIKVSAKGLPRRQFIKTALATSAGTFFIPRFAVGQAAGSSNSRLRLAIVGCGWIAGGWLRWSDDDIVAICDVDPRALAEAREKYPLLAGAKEFIDFRKMLDQMGDGIDAVIVNTPDNTHFPVTFDAMRRGKHVFTEKPLTHNIWQARTLAKMAARNPQLKTVMGNQRQKKGSVQGSMIFVD
jgi:hypothetical protein